MKAEIRKIWQRQKLAEMIYMSANGQVTKRRLRILRVGETTFQAYCLLRNEKRTFKIDRVLSIQPLLSFEKTAN